MRGVKAGCRVSGFRVQGARVEDLGCRVEHLGSGLDGKNPTRS